MNDPVSDLAHELRTPLSLIVGYAELLHTRADEETRAEAVPRILEAAKRLEDAIDALVGTYSVVVRALLALGASDISVSERDGEAEIALAYGGAGRSRTPGLDVARRVVELHGGTLIDDGARAIVRIPLASEES